MTDKPAGARQAARVRSSMSAEEWPIAAAMLQFPGTLRDGTRVSDASADVWEGLLRTVVVAGFTQVEVPSAWLRLGDLTTARLREFSDVLDGLRLEVPGISVVRESVIHPRHSARNLAFSHRTIDAAAALSVPIVCLGLHDALLPAQQEVLWFWTVAGPQQPTRPEVYAQAVSAYRELGKHAADVGVEISLELYEDTYLGTAAGSVQFIQDIDEPVVGLNPDLGNLIRHQGQIEPWQVILDAALPYTNYWHVKNYMRLEDPSTRCALSAPVTMETGIINYRHAVAEALRLGYRGAFVVEHYGGDGLSVGASNREYLRRILASALNEQTGPTK